MFGSSVIGTSFWALFFFDFEDFLAEAFNKL